MQIWCELQCVQTSWTRQPTSAMVNKSRQKQCHRMFAQCWLWSTVRQSFLHEEKIQVKVVSICSQHVFACAAHHLLSFLKKTVKTHLWMSSATLNCKLGWILDVLCRNAHLKSMSAYQKKKLLLLLNCQVQQKQLISTFNENVMSLETKKLVVKNNNKTGVHTTTLWQEKIGCKKQQQNRGSHNNTWTRKLRSPLSS